MHYFIIKFLDERDRCVGILLDKRPATCECSKWSLSFYFVCVCACMCVCVCVYVKEWILPCIVSACLSVCPHSPNSNHLPVYITSTCSLTRQQQPRSSTANRNQSTMESVIFGNNMTPSMVSGQPNNNTVIS